jgi:hypothetical protein
VELTFLGQYTRFANALDASAYGGASWQNR